MDEMQYYEIPILMKNLENSVKMSWEQTRWQMYSSLSPYSKNRLKVTDILKFNWDEPDHSSSTTNIKMSNEDIKKFSEMIKEQNKRRQQQ